MSLSTSDYNTYIAKKPSERYLENDGQLLIDLLEKNLKVKFTTTPNDTKTFRGDGLRLIETGPFQSQGLEVFRGYEGHESFTKLQTNQYALFDYPDGTIKGFEVFRGQTYPYVEMQTTYSHPLVPADIGGVIYQVKGTSGYNGLPTQIKTAFYSLLELLDRAFENNKSTGGKGTIKSLSSEGKSISYDDGELSNMLTIGSSIDSTKSLMIQGVINEYGLKPQPSII